VPFEVVNTDEGFVLGEREGLSCGNPDAESSDETGTIGYGDCVELGQGDLGSAKSLLNDRQNCFDMSPCGGFGYDSTPFLVHFDLGGDDVAEDLPAADDCRRCFIAGRFDGEN
jgi:hypothetical protein